MVEPQDTGVNTPEGGSDTIQEVADLLQLLTNDLRTQKGLLEFEQRRIVGAKEKNEYRDRKVDEWIQRSILMMQSLIKNPNQGQELNNQAGSYPVLGEQKINASYDQHGYQAQSNIVIGAPVINQWNQNLSDFPEIGYAPKLQKEIDDCLAQMSGLGHKIELEKGEDHLQRIKNVQHIPDSIESLFREKQWLQGIAKIGFALQNMHQDSKLIEIRDQGRMKGGDAGLAHLFTFRFEDGSEKKYVFKCSGKDEGPFKEWNKYREGVFHEVWAPQVRARVAQESNNLYSLNIPKTYVNIVDPTKGRYVCLMDYIEDIVPLDDVLREGDGNKLVQMLGLYSAGESDSALQQIIQGVAVQLANLHGAYWKDRDALLKGKQFMKAASWFHGEDKAFWEKHMNTVKHFNNEIKKKWSNDQKNKYSIIIEGLDSSAKACNWERQVALLNDEDYQWTMVHGDCWANNTLWGKTSNEISLVDFDFVGFWNPTVDLFYFMMHLPENRRREFEHDFYRAYHQRLMTYPRVPKTYTYERLLQDMRTHGVTRYITWFGIICLFFGEGGMTYLAPRIATFMEDHKIDAKNLGMPCYGFY